MSAKEAFYIEGEKFFKAMHEWATFQRHEQELAPFSSGITAELHDKLVTSLDQMRLLGLHAANSAEALHEDMQMVIHRLRDIDHPQAAALLAELAQRGRVAPADETG